VSDLDAGSRQHVASGLVATQLGKRYQCEVCGTETLCTKPGVGVVQCCGKEMQLKKPKPLASAD
jgi:transcription elongation factor Elf1